MARAERRAAQQLERQSREARRRREKLPVATRLSSKIRSADTFRVEGKENRHMSFPNETARLVSAEGGTVAFQHIYHDRVVGYDAGKVKTETTRHVTPSDQLLDFGIMLVERLEASDRVTLNPQYHEVHTASTTEPERLIGLLAEFGATATVTDPGNSDLPTSIEFTLLSE